MGWYSGLSGSNFATDIEDRPEHVATQQAGPRCALPLRVITALEASDPLSFAQRCKACGHEIRHAGFHGAKVAGLTESVRKPIEAAAAG